MQPKYIEVSDFFLVAVASVSILMPIMVSGTKYEKLAEERFARHQ